MSKRVRLLRSRLVNGVLYVWTYTLDGEVATHIVIKGSVIKVVVGSVEQ